MLDRSRVPPTRVVVVDDHPAVCEGLRTILGDDGIDVVAMAYTGAAALELVARHRPEVLVLDLRLPDLHGVQVARQVRATFPDVGILVYTGHDDVDPLATLLPLGVKGYLKKCATNDEFVSAVAAVAAGQTVLGRNATRAPLDAPAPSLTPREYEILRLVAAGRRNAEIANTLHIALQTLDAHIASVYRKLGVHSRARAILSAYRLGLVSLDHAAGAQLR